jgi:hypothetical protein
MGTDFRDVDNDGRPDIFVVGMIGDTFPLFRNRQRDFTDVSYASGVAASTIRTTAWGAGIADFDNDGWKDLFVAQGHVMDNIELVQPGLQYREVPLLARNEAGKLQRVAIAGAAAAAGRGAAFGDLDGNGTVDVIMTVLGDRPVIYRNAPNGNHWLIVSLVGSRSKRDGFGAKATVNGQSGYASSAGSYLSASDKRLHFGLGPAKEALLKIRWPSGQMQKLEHIAADRVVTVREP